ncbi:MAG: DUF72 domain-containing protein [Thermoproteota archaeon]|nr:DUF72 domain-containing protein [Candidatus Brockarchaeota archaeon]
MATIKYGCCGFPLSLSRYFSEFSLVELQSTFYKLPMLKTAEKWRKQAPDDFEFTLKAWQGVTHPPESPTWKRSGLSKGELKDYGNFNPSRKVFEAWDKTLEIAKKLSAKIVVFQTPPSFGPSPKNIDNMKKFFKEIDRGGLLLAWEPRGEWLDKKNITKSLLEKLELIHVVDPFWDQPLTTGVYYFRLHGLGKRYNYSYEYSLDDLKKLISIIRGLRDAEEVYVLFNNKKMLDSVKLFASLL